MRIKYFVGFAVLAAALFVASGANADEGDVPSIQIKANGAVSVDGAKVISVSGSTINASTTFGLYAVNWVINTDSRTSIVRRYDGRSSLSEIQTTDFISFSGALNNTSAIATVTASKIKDWSIQARGDSFSGIISNIDTAQNSFVLDLAGNKTVKVFVTTTGSDKTTIKRGRSAVAFADLKVGNKVDSTSGLYNNAQNTLQADTIVLNNVIISSIQITYPDTAGQVWYGGETHDITWTSTGVKRVYISRAILDDEGKIIDSQTYMITPKGVPAAPGKFSWTIPAKTVQQNIKNAEICVISSDSSMGAAGDCTKTFSIQGAQKSVTVIFPNGDAAGAQVLETGKTYKVTWSTANLSAKAIVNISLSDFSLATEKKYGLTTVFASSKSFSFKVPEKIGEDNIIGTKFKIAITYIGEENEDTRTSKIKSFSDYSDNFFSIGVPTIVVNGTCGTANGVAVSSAPTVDLCATGIASSVAGTGVAPWIWTCIGFNGGTNITCSAPVSNSTQPSVPNCDSLYSKIQVAWHASCNAIGYDGEYDPIADVNKDKLVGNGDYALFSTNFQNEIWCGQQLSNTTNPCPPQPSITVTSPNGGETWKIGETHNVTWNFANITNPEVAIQLRNPTTGEVVFVVSPNASILLKSFSWTIPSNVSPGQYKMYIGTYSDSTNTTLVQDYSDDYFSIVAPTTCAPDWTCTPWSTCSSGGQRTRTCTDSNNCGTTTGKPAESQSCTVAGCADTDGGKDYFTKGVVVDSSPTAIAVFKAPKTFTDLCYAADKKIFEYYCDANLGYSQGEWHDCPNGCSNGACNQATSLAPNGGSNNETLIASISAAIARITQQIQELLAAGQQ